jgi:hypothetical protein
MSLKREELAEMSGITPETLARILGTFQEDKLVMLDGRTITVTDMSRLSRIARCGYTELQPSSFSYDAAMS